MTNPSPHFIWLLSGKDNRPLVHSACISALSAQIFEPQCPRVFVAPEPQIQSLKELIPAWADGLIEFSPCTPPDEIDTDFKRSRWLKINALTHLKCDAWQLDADTIFVNHINWDEWPQNSISVVQDRVNNGYKEIYYRKFAKEHFEEAGWPWPDYCIKNYFNAGIFAYRHNEESLNFLKTWNQNWNHFTKTTGKFFDQSSFNKTAADLQICGELPVKYNAPVGILPQHAKNASIYHYYSTRIKLEENTLHLMGMLLKESLNNPNLTKDHIESKILGRHKPFVKLGAEAEAYKLAGQRDYYRITKARDNITNALMRLKTPRESIYLPIKKAMHRTLLRLR